MDGDIDEFCIQHQVNDKTKQILFANDVNTMKALLVVEEQELKDIGVKLGQLKLIMNGIEIFKAETSFEKVSNIGEGARGADPSKLLETRGTVAQQYENFSQQHRNFSTLPDKLNSYSEKMFGSKATDFIEIASEQEGSLKLIPCKLKLAYEDTGSEIRKCVAGDVTHHQKTILLVGQTGTGKSTLVNGIANYIFNVSYEDKHRLKLVNMSMQETQNSYKGQQVSQTEWITVYTIPPSSETVAEFTLNIVDTPGFADTRGRDRDKRLIKQIRDFFNNTYEHCIDTVNGICFVVKASDMRLTPEQQYIFEEILKLFGENVVQNIFTMATFSDGSKPAVLESMKFLDIRYVQSFQFNNSSLYLPPEEETLYTKVHWGFAMNSYESFFQSIMKTLPVSLKLSGTVLRTRDALSAAIDYIQDAIKLGCQTLHALEERKEILEQHKLDIQQGKDFEMEVEEVYTAKKNVQYNTTNCMKCDVTCCKNCWTSGSRYWCWSMNMAGNCKLCNCSLMEHKNGKFIHELKTRKVKTTYGQVKQDYILDTYDDLSNRLDDALKNEREKLISDISKNIRKAFKCATWLEKYALRKDNITSKNYTDVLIKDEKKYMKDGWEDRIKILEQIKETWKTSEVKDVDIDEYLEEDNRKIPDNILGIVWRKGANLFK